MNAFRSRPFLVAATITASLWSTVAVKPAHANIDKRQAYNQIENGQIQSVKSKLQEELRKNPANLQAANDLAVVLIAEDQPDAARGVLEAALLAHPNAADAFKNLRELAARQYADAYAKAMGTQSKRKDEPIRGAQLESQQVKRAIAMADAKAQEAARQAKLAAERAEAERQAKLSAEQARLAAADKAKREAEQQAAAAKGAAVAQANKPAETTTLAAANPSQAPKASNASAQPAAESAPPASSAAGDEALKQAVVAWADSWEKKNFKKYAGFYSENFKASKFPTKADWIDHRRPRVMNKGRISVRVDNIEVRAVSASTREVKFLQRYESGSLRVRTTKKQLWVLEGSSWRIRSEES
ncbi:MAG: hypothetical protein RLZZ80_131 [Pseudomonadota bacterium]|jgi:hypothetical protein